MYSNSIWGVVRAFNSCRQWCLNISDNEEPTSSLKSCSFLPPFLACGRALEMLVSRFTPQSALSDPHRGRRLNRKPPSYFCNPHQLKNEQPPPRAPFAHPTLKGSWFSSSSHLVSTKCSCLFMERSSSAVRTEDRAKPMRIEQRKEEYL